MISHTICGVTEEHGYLKEVSGEEEGGEEGMAWGWDRLRGSGGRKVDSSCVLMFDIIDDVRGSHWELV